MCVNTYSMYKEPIYIQYILYSPFVNDNKCIIAQCTCTCYHFLAAPAHATPVSFYFSNINLFQAGAAQTRGSAAAGQHSQRLATVLR